MNKFDLAESLSVSCVENYFLSWLKNYVDVRQFYYDSFISFGALADDFLSKNARYESYYGIKRIQDLTEECLCTRHRKINGEFNEDIFDGKNLVLMKVNRSFFENYLRNPWREDHYIIIVKQDGQYSIINNYPLDEKFISSEKLQRYYGGEFLVYECVNDFYSIKQEPEFNIKKLDIYIFKSREEMLIDIIGLYKVFYKRMIKYFEWLCVPNGANRFITDLNIFHAALEKMRIKSKYDYALIKDKIVAIIDNEKKIASIVTEMKAVGNG